jgi:predicted transposase/invertase (TIGR01784 family)
MADVNTLLNSDLESRYEKYKGIIKNFTLMSDIFMRNVFKKRECLQVIMEKQDLHVIDQIIQKDYKNLQGRSAVMDCVAKDSTGKQFDVEIQQDNEEASPKRARYHSGLMDMNTLNPGQDFEELPESYVIFITRDDILGYGLPIYHIDRQIKELEEAFQDEAHIIYVNSKKQDDTQLGRLMHDLHCKKADEMHSPILAKRVYELKETQKGVELMCHEMEKIYSEGMESGEKRGIEMGELKAKKETILSLAEMGIPVDKIAKAVNLSEKDVQKWIDENLCIMK